VDLLERFIVQEGPQAFDALRRIAEEAGRAIEAVQARRTDDGLAVHRKGDGSPVTAADEASHRILAAGLARIDPATRVVSEENAASHRAPAAQGTVPGGRAWVVDPLDGTKEFIAKRPEYVVNVGLMDGDRPVFGLVHVPATGDTYAGGMGVGAWRHGRGADWQPIHAAHAVAKPAPLRVVMSRSHRGERMDGFVQALARAGRTTEAVAMGSAWKFLLVAEGRADLYPRLGPTMWWDTLAPHAIVAAAGGSVTDLAGAPFRYRVAADGALRNGFFCVHGRGGPIADVLAALRHVEP
jgi:3'(2'), 5'-bisphosphate nucleotidase